MPTPEYLIPILDVLGDGGSVAMAERVHVLIDQAERAARAVDVAAMEDALANATARASVMDGQIRELTAEAADHKDNYLNACKTIADMHAAAVGEIRGPIRGVVEDVDDVRTCWLAAERRVKDLESLPEVIAAYRAHHAQHGAETPVSTGDLAAVRTAAVLPERLHDPATDGPALPDIPAAAYPPDAQPIPVADDDIDWDDDPDQVGDAARAHAEASGLDEFHPDTTHNPGPAATEPTSAEIRVWCQANGVPCSARGAVPSSSRQAYLDAQTPPRPRLTIDAPAVAARLGFTPEQT